jgi:hypothetical protein
MMHALLALALAACLAQEEEIPRLVRQLGDDSLERRDEAESLLRQAGEKALPELERASRSTDAEVAALARRLVVTIREDVDLARVLGPVRRVTVRVKDRPFREALAEIDRESGFATPVAAEVENRNVSVEAADRPYLEALDLLCVAHGDAHLEGRLAKLAARQAAAEATRPFEIRAGPTAAKPTVYEGPFRIRFESITIRRPDYSSLAFSVLWQPNVSPYHGAGMGGDVVVDDRGTDILADRRIDREAWRLAEPNASRSIGTSPSLWLPSKRPSDEALRLAHLKGAAGFLFALEESVLEYGPSDAGARREIAEYAVELSEFRVDAGRATVKFTCTRPDGRPLGSSNYFPISPEAMAILDESGAELPLTGGAGSWSQQLRRFEKSCQVPEGRKVAKVRVPALVRWRRYEVPFEFRDVPLPQW